MATIFRRRPAETTDDTFLRECADFGADRLHNYALYQDFYDGEHRTLLTDRQRTYLEAAEVRWAENFVDTVINIVKERMNIVGFQVDGRDEVSDWLTKRAWQGNRMDVTQGIVRVNTMVKGDGFVTIGVNDDAGRPRFKFNRPELFKPVYDDDDRMVYAVKKWAASGVSRQNPKGASIWRMNVYYPDRCEKYFSADREGKQWARYSDDTDTTWPVWLTGDQEPDGEPLGIPVVHFRNQAFGQRMGRSDVRGLIPFQHELHKQLLDLFDVMDSQGWPQRWATGSTAEDGSSIKTNPGEVWTGPAEARFGQFDPAPVKGALDAIAATFHRMATKARVPVHLLMLEGAVPSGESLKTAESPLVKKAEDRKVNEGDAWEDAQDIGWRYTSAWADPRFEVPVYDGSLTIQTLWDSSESRNEQSEAVTAGLLYDLGASRTTLLRGLGYDPVLEAGLRAKEDAAAGPLPPDGGAA